MTLPPKLIPLVHRLPTATRLRAERRSISGLCRGSLRLSHGGIGSLPALLPSALLSLSHLILNLPSALSRPLEDGYRVGGSEEVGSPATGAQRDGRGGEA